VKQRLTQLSLVAIVFWLVTISSVWAQQRGNKASFVTLEPTPALELQAGKSKTVEIRFRVNSGFHINSNKPNSDLLIPTEIKFEKSRDFSVGKLEYPTGHEFALSFAPQEKMSVYEGDVSIQIPLMVSKSAKSGAYQLNGTLTYQACNDNSCFPPKTIPLTLNLTIKKK
jgi:DsbC/DsbD-like thiol-disulfide interchange protein